ncbi:MAG: DNA-formamidopyrimidine glycosylase family protein [Dehalococcoidia bacterium]
MPEIPDLEAIRHFLEPRLRQNPVATAEARLPWLVRTGADALPTLVGHEFASLRRHGKFLLFATDDDRLLVVNPMLTGRFHWAEPSERKRPMTALVLGFSDGHELRYSDQRRMGRWYLVPTAELATVPQMAELGPDALAVDEETFLARIKKHPGQIKSVLTNQKFLAGIGNAYSDEILWEAGLHPHRRRATMSEDDLRRLYRAMRSTIEWAIPILEAEVADRLYQRNEEWRDHLRVHRKAEQPCPRCGEPIHAQVRGGSETNYCLHCQPLVLG